MVEFLDDEGLQEEFVAAKPANASALAGFCV
jgi:hypothetical protein